MPQSRQPAAGPDFPQLSANLAGFAGALAATAISLLTRRFGVRNAHSHVTITGGRNIVRHHYRCCCVPPCYGCRR